MATIKAIEARSVHQIQSGQVIVDLCSVAKELVENSLDAGATSIEVRFKNNGLDSIEVQDNGGGISPANYESVALKHYTSKLSSYDDLSSLRTFGFRGEALSSLCALSKFHIVTAQADEAPKGKRLDFEISGKLTSTSIVAAQLGTTVSVEGLFERLPVRRKELAKNIKREYGKVIGLLHAYACISTGVKFTVRSTMAKGKPATVFSTKSNPTTKENIANVYGAKTLAALLALDLQLEFEPSTTHRKADDSDCLNKIVVRGHISRPVFGQGRQTPDRQMFFVNSRPCGLPQVAKAINEVYKSFNVSQSPFIFADLQMDTNAYDVNVSPDKRTILLHDSSALIEELKSRLIELFDQQEQTMPQSQLQNSKMPAFKKPSIQREATRASTTSTDAKKSLAISDRTENHGDDPVAEEAANEGGTGNPLLHAFFQNQASTRESKDDTEIVDEGRTEETKERLSKKLVERLRAAEDVGEYGDVRYLRGLDLPASESGSQHVEDVHVRDFNARVAEAQKTKLTVPEPDEEDEAELDDLLIAKQDRPSNLVQIAFDRVRPLRPAAEMATITIGDYTSTALVGSQAPSKDRVDKDPENSMDAKRQKIDRRQSASAQLFSQSLRDFAAPGASLPSLPANGNGSVHSGEADEEKNEEEEDEEDRTTSIFEEVLDESELAVDTEPRAEEEEEDEREPALFRDNHHVRPHAADSEEDYIDDEDKKAEEDARVAELIRMAEESAAQPTKEELKRKNQALKPGSQRDSTVSVLARIHTSVGAVKDQMTLLQQTLRLARKASSHQEEDGDIAESDEERLSLTVSKADFGNMNIVGQFNLGFILATRPGADGSDPSATSLDDELFIIDQHASDEKFNFERLQADTVVGNQRLVRPKPLDLTAVEEEVVIENEAALEKNGFIVEVDLHGDQAVGQRCKLVGLPLSREVVFDTKDLDELIHLLSESPTANAGGSVPRPSKVRKMFAMRACRSSVMIGTALSEKQMSTLVRHMGTIDKPWNCPHGRPTMRHLMSLDAFETWEEGDGPTDEMWGTYGR